MQSILTFLIHTIWAKKHENQDTSINCIMGMIRHPVLKG